MRYYIDFIEGDRLSRDEDGLEFADLDAACAEAVRTLPAVVTDEFGARERIAAVMAAGGCSLSVQVRDGDDRILFRARLSLDLDCSIHLN